ncbi:MAG: substrate-binding domain-containing protein [Verrucomicrobiaceae bacterium]|nr:substrate-binding domain-containing protein [Verrucomicrobiaceae bacterium]
MKPLRRQTLTEQAASHLREGFQKGRWAGQLPGVGPLADELGVSKDTIRAALSLLEEQGLIKSSGWGKRREIITRRPRSRRSGSLRIGILLRETLEQDNTHSVRLILGIRHALESAGHACFIARRTIIDCGEAIPRIQAQIDADKADAWIVYGGSYEILRWFIEQKVPVFAIGGRFDGLHLASTATRLDAAMHQCVDALHARGHQRIVFVVPAFWRHPNLSKTATAFVERLQHHGLQPHRDYHVPDWTETPEGLQQLFEALFRTTPPTALLLLEPGYTIAALAFLAQRGLRVPEDISLVSLMTDPLFHYRVPEISHFDWPIDIHVKRVAQWVDAIAAGTAIPRATEASAVFREGQTIAPAPAGATIHTPKLTSARSH